MLFQKETSRAPGNLSNIEVTLTPRWTREHRFFFLYKARGNEEMKWKQQSQQSGISTEESHIDHDLTKSNI